MTNLLDFVATYLGKAGAGTNPTNRGQCVGLIELWLAAQQLPAIGGNAVDLLANADLRIFRVIHNLPNNAPRPGDIVCWNISWGGGYGHTAVVLAASVMRMAVFEQNDPVGSPPLVATHSYDGVAGWIVPPWRCAMILAWSDVWSPQGIVAVVTALTGLVGGVTLLVKALRTPPAAAPEPSHPEPPHGTPPAAA